MDIDVKLKLYIHKINWIKLQRDYKYMNKKRSKLVSVLWATRCFKGLFYCKKLDPEKRRVFETLLTSYKLRAGLSFYDSYSLSLSLSMSLSFSLTHTSTQIVKLR